MAVFIELVTDAFEDVFRSQSAARQGGGGRKTGRAGKTIVRRPVRGIEIKDDTYAYLKVIMANGKALPLLDSSSILGTNESGYTNFILQSVTEQRMEKHQIVETFGDSYVFFFGESPRFLDCQAVLINSHDFNWRAEWWYNYEHYLRGTKLVEYGARCYLFWDDNVVEGYMLMANANEIADSPYTVSLQFRFFVTKYQNINLSNVEQFPTRSSIQLPAGVELTQADAFDKLQAYYRGDSGLTRAQDSVVREQSVLSNYLQSGGGTPGALAGDAPKVQVTGPGMYSFGGSGSTTSTDLGIGIATAPANTVQSGEAYAPYQTITQKLRQLPPSIVTDPAIWNALRGTTGVADINDQSIIEIANSARGGLRGLIAENIDEYVNGTDGYPGIDAYMHGSSQSFIDPIYRLGQAITKAQELSYSLPYSVITTLNALGISADNPQAMTAMGLAPNFSPGYVANTSAYTSVGASFGAGMGAATSFGGSSSQCVSYSPLSNASMGVVAGGGVGLSARAGYFANATGGGSYLGTSSGYTYKDPLGAIYGRSTATTTFSADAHKYVEGAGCPEYGYTSPYGDVGYGRTGFGDFGGDGYGGCSASGDPGFRDPALVSTKVSQSARVRYDMTALTAGPTLGGSSIQGGASLHVGGVSTGFSLTAFEGDFEAWVLLSARVQPTYGQAAAGPGCRSTCGPDVGYAAFQRSQYPESQAYVGGVTARASITLSAGFI
jgi:hypothetical protein